ncbi:uncharacterized protein LTR77_000980 [Saxophila tyrrhenica]|uniref:Pyridoxamine 5'-phosphate oxidase N-terminal domain-containing protein n=1 Tax=Saxophila tyrrhenica TaxID=1690608 RepID=A0AAV9PSU5_9PEZI|nr:hypothetical protein LTR77_000980 [Saxophila tyrrhenica]
MGVFYETIPESMIEWIRKQHVFWVATAPLSASGHVNVSPKGGQYFGVLDEKTFWYHDLSGSGNETISHIYENGRITIQLCAFEGGPKIVRLWGKGQVLENGTKDFSDFVSKNSVELLPGTRSIIIVDIHQVGSSCGFSVPFYDFKAYRPVLNDHFAKKEKRFKEGKADESMDHYWAYKSSWSMDGLPGMKRGLSAGKKHKVEPLKKMVGPLAPTRYHAGLGFSLLQTLLIALLAFMVGLAVAWYGGPMIEDVLSGVKSSPLDLHVPNWTQAASRDRLSGLWATH